MSGTAPGFNEPSGAERIIRSDNSQRGAITACSIYRGSNLRTAPDAATRGRSPAAERQAVESCFRPPRAARCQAPCAWSLAARSC